jgi:hypothetical protein
MTNLFILNTIIEENADYSQLITNLTGGFVPADIENTEIGEDGEEEIVVTAHPHANLESPDFSGKLIFIHLTDGFNEIGGVDHIKSSKFKFTTAWNEGVAYAKSKGATHVAILNNISNINPHVISLGFDGNEDKSVINLSDGAAFIVTSDFSVEEKYNFWFVDNEIFTEAVEAGTFGRPSTEEPSIIQSELVSSKEAFESAIQEDYKTAGIK